MPFRAHAALSKWWKEEAWLGGSWSAKQPSHVTPTGRNILEARAPGAGGQQEPQGQTEVDVAVGVPGLMAVRVPPRRPHSQLMSAGDWAAYREATVCEGAFLGPELSWALAGEAVIGRGGETETEGQSGGPALAQKVCVSLAT